MTTILPARYRPSLPLDRLILSEPPAAEAIELDVLIVGAGPAGLAAAIELARLTRQNASLGEVSIGVLEKASALGEHCLSGAVVNPRAFRELFPETPEAHLPFRQPAGADAVYLLTERRALRIPTPPTMRNHGNYTASLCEVVRWLGERAEEMGVNLFLGFPAAALLVEGSRVRGVRTTPGGLGRDGQPGEGYAEPTDIAAKVTILAEGTRGALGQAWRQWQGVTSPNPQLFALGVKEVWQVPRPLVRVVHTLGWPLPRDAFGGTFMYPMGPSQISIGIVVGLDYRDAWLDVHELLQRTKLHPLFRAALDGGELLEWGAKTIPEGGYYSLPDRLSGDGLILAGDTAGFVDVPSLKGIHYAMQSGLYAARAALAALTAGDTTAAGLEQYDRAVRGSWVLDDLRRTRNMRLAFKDGFYVGGLKSGLMTLTGGRFPGRPIAMHEDAEQERRQGQQGQQRQGGQAPLVPDRAFTFSKTDAVFKSGNATRDTIPSHLIVGPEVTPEVAEFYSHVCPAGVYELAPGGALRVNPPNCVDCKATDVLGPRWTPREGGSGPKYRLM